ncbi:MULTISPECIES: tonB-system energizer ExbB [Komagataeibacter]|uniref:Biopolymer transport protein ExbB n=2 Tax=Komagataeibacter TaxID=1434011 RepID=A0A318QWG2_9PROT|nr:MULTISPECIES: tonB-system energizer ExbB [Komagataeibacter]GBR28012.1 ExbB/TolQ/MotA proton channel family protein [Komagataeibacter oboediens DSM 11826]MBL7233185.1 tonB-system energizer ExbB [Komagataeibacter oboediens]MBT0675468.1 tonB-system energizer ExbB [Komagataeibacter oboediens]MBT0679715.1 tonB-system energizer ExbB [Komagataeibacter oboediens]MBV0889644.1 tonB-system energizer ExbB [Komagataeibacter oboediens]
MTPIPFSPWDMFLNAGPVVRCVMLLLGAASVLTWTIFVAKSAELLRMRVRLRAAENALEDANTLDLGEEWTRENTSIAHALVMAAETERHRSADIHDDGEGVKERIALHLERLEAAEGRRLLRGTGVLATIGATSPFIGLFGTVWGIMTSFTGIAASRATSLAVVAPGIAEALLATALGLVAAIPAVVIYNHLARQTAACRAQVADLTALVMRLVSRDLGRARMGQGRVVRLDARADNALAAAE